MTCLSFEAASIRKTIKWFGTREKSRSKTRTIDASKWGSRICHNEVRRTKIGDGIAQRIKDSGLLKPTVKLEEVRKILDGTEVDDLTEFSRAIHAEMEAILTVAREGRHSLVGATMFTTTYPCHNCARHIVAAGISKLIYIEPYHVSAERY